MRPWSSTIVLAAILASISPVSADDWPNKPIRAIASQGPGGLSDVFMRALADGLGPILGQSVVVENRVGAAGSIGARACSDAEPDGYTLCILNNESMVINPLIVFVMLRLNHYPLVFTCLRESGVSAFFTRSSAANIPVNLQLCERLGLHEDTYSVSIPLGATINMAGAAITISVLSLAAANTLGIAIDLPSALLLCVVASLCACGASGG